MITGQIDSDQADYIESVIHQPKEIEWVLEKVTSGYYEDCPGVLFHEDSGESPQLVKPVFPDGGDEWIWHLLCQIDSQSCWIQGRRFYVCQDKHDLTTTFTRI